VGKGFSEYDLSSDIAALATSLAAGFETSAIPDLLYPIGQEIAHGLLFGGAPHLAGMEIVRGVQQGILQNIPQAVVAMTVLGATITAVAATQGAEAGKAYGAAFGRNASIQFSVAVAKIKREIDQLNIRILRGYGTP
jgi:hypothetical protein